MLVRPQLKREKIALAKQKRIGRIGDSLVKNFMSAIIVDRFE